MKHSEALNGTTDLILTRSTHFDAQAMKRTNYWDRHPENRVAKAVQLHHQRTHGLMQRFRIWVTRHHRQLGTPAYHPLRIWTISEFSKHFSVSARNTSIQRPGALGRDNKARVGPIISQPAIKTARILFDP